MKQILVLVIALLTFPTLLQAATITKTLSFGWTYTAAEEAEITGFEICNYAGIVTQDNAVVVIGGIPKSARGATGLVTFDDKVTQRFFIRAVSVDPVDPTIIDRSEPSNVVRLLISPSRFKRN